MQKRQKRDKGFTLVELVVVIAILAILVGLLAPSYTKYVERSRESTDLANVRTEYGEMMADINLDGKDPEEAKRIVPLKQKIDDWQSAETITIAGISHTVGEANTENWVGIPHAGGNCEISLNDDNSVRFTWTDGKESGGKKYPFDMKEDLMGPLSDSGLLSPDSGILNVSKAPNFELDSKANTPRVKKIKEQIKDNSLLKSGTWAYLGRGEKENADRRYLFWTSVDVSTVNEKTEIPVIIFRADGKYYVSKSTTAQRKGNDIKIPYMTIADRQPNANSYQDIANNGYEYNSLQEAYDAYVKKITEDSNYSQFKDTLPKNQIS